MSIITRQPDGKITIKSRQNKTHIVNPDLVRQSNKVGKSRPEQSISNRFKLVTVRRLTNITIEEANAKLKATQEALVKTAIATGQPVPYPAKEVSNTDNLKQVYGVYVDEDLYGKADPVYVFNSASSSIKTFITSNGADRDDWSVHIAHLVDKIKNPDSTFTTSWRLITIDKKLKGNSSTYILESQSLPPSYSFNFDIDNLNYLGGGCWTAMAVDLNDRIPVYAMAPTDTDRYIRVGQPYRIFGVGAAMSLVSYSLTPSRSFTWCRGVLKQTYRERFCNSTFDVAYYKDTGVIKTVREHSYTLPLCYRPALPGKTELIINEYVQGTATYVGNSNLTVSSLYQSPDFNTDVGRLAIANYTQTSNIVRPSKLESSVTLSEGKGVKQDVCHIPVLAASNDFGFFIRYDAGTLQGSINHPDEIKHSAGSRGFQYGDDYKYWWGYGKVLAVTPYGDSNRYRTAKTTGIKSKIGSMFDLGELKIDKRNRIITTWDSLPFPQTGFFALETGTLKFIVQYVNPPLMGHDGVYYYEINPPRIGAFSTAGDRTYEGNTTPQVNGYASSTGLIGGSDDAKSQQNKLIYAYGQITGALGGDTLINSFNIGLLTIGKDEIESIIVRSPDSVQKAYLAENPETFPGGFYPMDRSTTILDNANHGYTSSYDSEGDLGSTDTF